MPPLATSRPAASEMMSAGICETRPSPTDSLVKTSEAAGQRHAMAGDADDDAAENVDAENDEAGDRVAAHEFRGAVHRAEERALLLEFAPALLRDLLVDQPRREIGVDRHLLAGNRVEREARADLGDTRRALGDDEEVDGDEDQEDDDADDEIAAHHQPREAGDDVARRRVAAAAMRQDQARGRDVERQPQHGGDQQHRRKRRELQRLLDPQRHHEDQHGQRDGKRQAEVDQDRRAPAGRTGTARARCRRRSRCRRRRVTHCSPSSDVADKSHSPMNCQPRLARAACASPSRQRS